MTATTEAARNGRAINVEQAEIRTATVTVRALTIDRRQVTLAVFRQLREEPVVDQDTGEFHGLPWGTVNYCPPRGGCYGEHLHVVWQSGDELRRATQYAPAKTFSHDLWRWSARGDWLLLALDEGWRPKTWDTSASPVACWVQFADGLPAVLCPLPSDHTIERFVGAARHLPHWQSAEYLAELADRGLVEVSQRAAEIRDRGDTSDGLAGRIRDEVIRQHDLWEKHRARYQELQALPQLFIAT